MANNQKAGKFRAAVIFTKTLFGLVGMATANRNLR